MIIRFARHGQPNLDTMGEGFNHELPPADYQLSKLGRLQAEYLGKHLAERNFRGMIIASPYARTTETADIVAGCCGLKFYLEGAIQEMRFYEEPVCPGMTIEEIRAHYPNVAPDAELPYPWMVPGGKEEIELVRKRVDAYVEKLIAAPPADDILLVGHGASLQSLKWNFYERCGYTGKDRHNYNCSLSGFEVKPDGSAVMLEVASFGFIPLEYVTSNRRLYGDPECV